MSKCGWGCLPSNISGSTGVDMVAVGRPASNIGVQMAANQAVQGYKNLAMEGMSTGAIPVRTGGRELV